METNPSLDSYRNSARWMQGPHGEIAWWTKGSGRPLLLIHGFPTCSYDWLRIWPGLVQAGFDPIALDMLGFGLSDKPEHHRYHLMQQSDLQVQLMRQLGHERCDIIAHDYGVSIAQELLARQEAGRLDIKIDKVIFLNGGLFPDQHRARLIQRLLNSPLGGLISQAVSRGSFGRSFAAVFGPHSQPDEDELDLFWSLMAHKNGHRIGHRLIKYIEDRKAYAKRWEAALETQTAQIFMINGVHDPVSGAHLADTFASKHPGAPLKRLDVGHYPQWEDADAVLAQSLEWLK